MNGWMYRFVSNENPCRTNAFVGNWQWQRAKPEEKREKQFEQITEAKVFAGTSKQMAYFAQAWSCYPGTPLVPSLARPSVRPQCLVERHVQHCPNIFGRKRVVRSKKTNFNRSRQVHLSNSTAPLRMNWMPIDTPIYHRLVLSDRLAVLNRIRFPIIHLTTRPRTV